jgi:hypothetical protein
MPHSDPTGARLPEITSLELFFDLVFVFAVSQLSHHLLAHTDWRGAAETLVMLTDGQDHPRQRYAARGAQPIGRSRSTSFAQARSCGSENRGPMICRPTGRPDADSPAGTLAAGSAASETRKVCATQSM